MVFVEGTTVSYKSITGVIDFVCEHSVSILVRRGRHKSQDVKVVVYPSSYHLIEPIQEK